MGLFDRNIGSFQYTQSAMSKLLGGTAQTNLTVDISGLIVPPHSPPSNSPDLSDYNDIVGRLSQDPRNPIRVTVDDVEKQAIVAKAMEKVKDAIAKSPNTYGDMECKVYAPETYMIMRNGSPMIGVYKRGRVVCSK